MGGRVLIVDDVATNRIVMKVKLTAAGYLPVVAADGAGCLALAIDELPDLILLDHGLPDMLGAEVLRRLRAIAATRHVPVVVFSASSAEEARIEAFRAGADDFLVKPIDDQTLLARIRSLIRAHQAMAGLNVGLGQRSSLAGLELPDLDLPALDGRELPAPGLAEGAASFQLVGATGQPMPPIAPQPAALMPGLSPAATTIALVMQRPETALFLRRNIAGKIASRVIALTPDEALTSTLKDGPAPDLFVIEADLPIPGGGLRLMSDLRSRSASCHASFAIYRARPGDASAAMAFDLGADDLIAAETAPLEVSFRFQRLLALKHQADRLRLSVKDGLRLAMIDPLTGLHNRRYGLAQMQAIAQRASVTGSVFAVLVADIDQFKSVNDRFGHGAGDAVLVEVARRLRDNLRGHDLLARIGGEEFLIALPDIALAEARGIAERLCKIIATDPFDLGHDTRIGVTISIGLAISQAGAAPTQLETITEIVERADRALMHSKAAGHNQVTIGRTAA
ncbi:MAG: diguanylate cyclase [Alphaproteobacteria bacterium]|nr:diguanylate cyclase [Alphaproteobacteria bacterium]